MTVWLSAMEGNPSAVFDWQKVSENDIHIHLSFISSARISPKQRSALRWSSQRLPETGQASRHDLVDGSWALPGWQMLKLVRSQHYRGVWESLSTSKNIKVLGIAQLRHFDSPWCWRLMDGGKRFSLRLLTFEFVPFQMDEPSCGESKQRYFCDNAFAETKSHEPR